LTAAGGARDPLFDVITQRRTNREPYEAREVPAAAIAAIAAAAGPAVRFGSATSGELREALRELAWEAFDREIRTPVRYQESVDLMRIGRAEITAHRDGLAMEGLMVELALVFGLLDHRVLADLDNRFVKRGIEAFRPLALEAPAFVWTVTADNRRTTQIAAGRSYARMNLAATAAGLAMHPWSQALQEYPEMAGLHAEAERLLNAPDAARVQMLARVGYASSVRAAPRRGLDAHLQSARPTQRIGAISSTVGKYAR
jgi:hypothetical protein